MNGKHLLFFCLSFVLFQAREAVETRARVEKQIAKKEKERKEERLRELALHARTNRAGISTTSACLGHLFIWNDCLFLMIQVKVTKKVLNVIRFDKKDKRNDNVLQHCNELVVINGKSQRKILEKKI